MGQNTIDVTESSFAADVEQQKGLVLVDFWATWCGPCLIIAPVLDQLAKDYAGKVRVTKLDVDANQRVAARFNIRSIPTLLFFKDGKHVDTVIGALPKPAIESKIQHHLAA
jgi:thioredoxin 1